MLDSNLISVLHQDLGNPIPDTVKGSVTLFGGLFLVVGVLNGALLIPLIMLALLLIVFTWREKMVIDFANGTYTKQKGPFGFRIGTKKSFGTPEFVAIREKALRDGGQFILMKSATSRTMTIALMAFEESDNMLLIMQSNNASKIMEEATAIALHYNIPLEDERA